MRQTASGTPVYFDTERLLKNLDKDKKMQYGDGNRGSTQISYNGKLVDLADAQYRLTRDKARQHYYEWSEDQLDEEQLTWDEVNRRL